jgi:hypothetical protein
MSQYSCLIRVAQVVDRDVLRDVHAIRAGRELYAVGALKLAPGGAPVRVNHDPHPDCEIGRVVELSEWNDGTGTYVFAHTVLDERPEWVRRGCAASMSWANTGAVTQMPGDWVRFASGIVTEVSVLTPYTEPAEARAKVVLVERIAPGSSRATKTSTNDELVDTRGEMIRRPVGGRVLRVR